MVNKHLLLTLFLCLFVQQGIGISSPSNPAENAWFKEMIGQLHFVEGRLVSLAEAIPEEKFTWRPAEGVRSVAEVFNHAAGANYYLLSFMGGKMPEGFTPDYEKTVTKKADIIKMLKESFEYARNFIENYKEENLDKEVELPFGKFSQRSVLFILMNHGHEHLGQSIAYARMNDVVPPWSQKED